MLRKKTMKLFSILLLLFTINAYGHKRCSLRPKVTTTELKIIFPGYTVHTDYLNSCELLLKIHDYRRKFGMLSLLMDNRIKKAYINEEVNL